MSSVAQVTAVTTLEENPFSWFWNFLKRELAPYPGRGWTVARMTIAATIVMLLIMIFRLPNAALGSYYTLLLSRENPRATLRSAVSMLASVGTALIFVLVTAAVMTGSPMLHFFWVGLTLFVTFFLIDALSEYRMGTAFGFLAVTSVTSWDFPANPKTLVENTLWTALAVSLGAVTTVVVEYVSFRIHPQDQVREGIEDRLRVVELMLRDLAADREAGEEVMEKLEQYAMTGTALLRRSILHSGESLQRKQELSAIAALTGRIVDLSANAKVPPSSEEQRRRYLQAADALQTIRQFLPSGDIKPLEKVAAAADPVDNSSFLTDLQMTIAEIPQIIAGLERRPEFYPSAVDFDTRPRLFKQGAFSGGESVRFALRGTLAALTCYVVYNAIEWRGLATSVSTCMITALSNVGSSRQKQFLRVSGTVLGGVAIGMTAQVVLLPYMDSIASFAILFSAVTAFSGWIATSSPRLSYAGVQTAFAFYVTHLRVFGPQTSLSVARDDVMGILLGLLAMWMLFDTIWAKDAASEMTSLFVRNLRRVAAFHSHIPAGDLAAGINKARVERAAINSNFDEIRNLSDSVVFEFGTDREWKMELRRIVRVLQPQLRAYFLLEISILHHQTDTHGEGMGGETAGNIERAEHILYLLADQAEQTWAGGAAAINRDQFKARHDGLCRTIEQYEAELSAREADLKPGPNEEGHALTLSRWMLGAALALGRSLVSLEKQALLAPGGKLTRFFATVTQ
jgi:multidrug resistance protein MdtO